MLTTWRSSSGCWPASRSGIRPSREVEAGSWSSPRCTRPYPRGTRPPDASSARHKRAPRSATSAAHRGPRGDSRVLHRFQARDPRVYFGTRNDDIDVDDRLRGQPRDRCATHVLDRRREIREDGQEPCRDRQSCRHTSVRRGTAPSPVGPGCRSPRSWPSPLHRNRATSGVSPIVTRTPREAVPVPHQPRTPREAHHWVVYLCSAVGAPEPCQRFAFDAAGPSNGHSGVLRPTSRQCAARPACTQRVASPGE